MSVPTVRRNSILLHEQVYYCSSADDFKGNWVSWGDQDCDIYKYVKDFDVIFGVIRKGIFHYVEYEVHVKDK